MWPMVEQESMHEKPPRMLPGSPGQAFASWGVGLDSEVTSAATARGPGQMRGPRAERHRCGGRKQKLFWSDGFCVFYAVGSDIAPGGWREWSRLAEKSLK